MGTMKNRSTSARIIEVLAKMAESGVVVALNVAGANRQSAAQKLNEQFGGKAPIVWTFVGDVEYVAPDTYGRLVHPNCQFRPARYMAFLHDNGGGELLIELMRAAGFEVDDYDPESAVMVYLTERAPDLNLGRVIETWCGTCDAVVGHTLIADAYPIAENGYEGACVDCGTRQYVEGSLVS
jgi:hypothetical protein